MKMLKKGLLVLTAFVFIFAFTACGCSSEETKSTKDGAVIYCEAGELCMVTTASEVLVFNVENAEIDSVDAVGYGDLAEVEYTGEITDGDTSEVTVTKVTAIPADLFEEEADKVSKNNGQVTIAAVSDTVYVTTNDVAVRSSYDVKAERIGTVNKGKKLTRTGKTSNGWSRIKYDGKDAFVINKYLTTKAPKQKDTKTTAKKTEQKTTQATTAVKTTSMDGAVKEVVDNKLTITTATSNEYTFNIKGVAYDVVLDPGKEITVVFEGDEENIGKVISITAR